MESVLFGSGRPVMIVPYIQREPVKLDHVVCCWDGSATAARAIADAAPLLARAKTVELLLVINGRENKSEEAGADMATHLARHNLNVTLKKITSIDIDVGDAILSYAADSAADFPGDGWLRPFAVARVPAGRRHTPDRVEHDPADFDVTLERVRLPTDRILRCRCVAAADIFIV